MVFVFISVAGIEKCKQNGPGGQSLTMSKANVQERKDFEKFTKFLIYKSIQVIVQSRLGEKIKTKSKPLSSGADWFNLVITDNSEVQSEAKKILSGQSTTLGQNVCIEISLRTAEGDTMVLEMWSISLDSSQCDNSSKSSHTTYNRMSIALKSLLSVSRVTPTYKLSRRQGTCANDYVICYRLYLGDPQLYVLGDGYEKARVGSVPTPFGTIGISLAYRTKLLISPQKTGKDSLFDVKDDHFKRDSSPKRPSTPKPCSQGYKRESSSTSLDTAGQSEESCNTTFSASPPDAPNNRMGANHSHYQSQPIRINVQNSSPEVENVNDVRAQSAPEKPFTGKEVHRVGAFVQQYSKDKSLDTDDIPFMSLLQQNKPELKLKADPVKIELIKGVAGTKNDGSKTDTSDSALSESKTSVSSQASVPDDFVMVELKTPFAGTDANSDLGKFYRDCQVAPTLQVFDEEQTTRETLEQLGSQLDMFETSMKDFDDFVSTLQDNSDNENVAGETNVDDGVRS